VPDGAVAAADGGGEPGPGGQLARRGEPADVTGLGQMTSAVNGPAPGSWVRSLTRGSDRACWRICQPGRSMTGSSVSMSARSPSMTSRETAGSCSDASQSRPGPLQHPAGRS